ncbi:MAG TPA: tRNA pseudouridine(55) synthase TruB [Gemmatimonadaceae bacterium]
MRTSPIDGLLLVDKPAGVTSHDVVSVARRALGVRRIGHAGTLDPFATGLLVLLVGRATRLLPYLDGEPKRYEATVRFGAETTTDDLTGEPVRTAPPPDRAAAERAMGQLTGELSQVPPAFSAKKVDGRRAYDAARRGEPVALAPVRVHVHEWRVREWRGDDVDVRITCGGGTYVRALARDLGRLTGSAAHLAALRRVGSGAFDVGDAVPLDALRQGAASPRPARDAVRSLPAQMLDDDALARVARGQPVDATAAGARAALVDAEGTLVAIGEREGACWRPRVVMRDG